MTDYEELEFAAREYSVATAHLIDVLSKHDSISPVIAGALMLLSQAINTEWGENA